MAAMVWVYQLEFVTVQSRELPETNHKLHPNPELNHRRQVTSAQGPLEIFSGGWEGGIWENVGGARRVNDVFNVILCALGCFRLW